MKKCKHCKEQFEQAHFNQQYCFKEECKNVWIKLAREKQWKKRKAELMKDLNTIPKLTKKAQIIFNEFIRLRDHGQVCISCRKVAKKENAGHYFSAGHHGNIRFDELNVHLQCEPCNNNLSGNPHQYRIHLKKKIGDDQYVLLEQRAYLTKKWTREELNEIIDTYSSKIKILKKELELK